MVSREALQIRAPFALRPGPKLAVTTGAISIIATIATIAIFSPKKRKKRSKKSDGNRENKKVGQ